jgi:hypothetical protein
MTRPRFGSAFAAQLNVRAASLLVPRSDRSAWTAEWLAEIHHLCHFPGQDVAPDTGSLRFSLGAFHDAFWIRCDLLRSRKPPVLQSGSAARSLLLLSSGMVAALLIGLALPGTRNALLPVPYLRPANLVVISSDGYAGTESPSIRFSDYEEWTTNTSALFSQIAFYRPTIKGLHLEHHLAARLEVAEASPNLFQLLNLRISGVLAAESGPSRSRLFLSREAWHVFYSSDPTIVGRTADIDGRPVLITGILPNDGWRLPGRVDAVLLEDPRSLATLPSTTRGFVIARIRNSAFPAPRGGERTMVEMRDGVKLHFDCITLGRLLGQPSFLFSLLLALLALPATTALPLGDYPRRHGRLPAMLNARRWLFLIAKFVLVVLTVDLCSTDLAYGLYAHDPIAALYTQLAIAFPALLFSFRWILQDQRRRCPECLRLLSNPARVGQASCNFLSWNGTELFCSRGHGLLHIPELPTSWFSTQRWLCLDSSWLCLFPENCSASPEMV